MLNLVLCINPFPNKPWFLLVCSTSVLQTLWEKEKLLVTSNFSFSRSVYYHFGELSAIFIKPKIVVCKLFQFGRVKFVVWERVKMMFVMHGIVNRLLTCDLICQNVYSLIFIGNSCKGIITDRSTFSSTGRRPVSYCHGVLSVVRPSGHPAVRPSVCASINSSFKKLLRNYWLDFYEISQECSLGGPLSNSFK